MNIKFYTIGGVIAIATASLYFAGTENTYNPRKTSHLKSIDFEDEESEEMEIGGAIDQIYSMRNNQITGTVDYADFVAAKAGVKSAALRRVAKKLKWDHVGPDNLGGRTRAIIIDRNDPNIMYMGSVSGGLFKSTTRGTSWKPVGDQDFNLNVVSLTQAPNGDIYYGTGEGNFASTAGRKDGTPSFQGGGVYRSTDGINFTLLTSTNNSTWQNTNRLASDVSTDVIYAGLNSGFYRSENNGGTWTRTQAGDCKEVRVTKSGTIYISIASSIYKSTDKGATFTKTAFAINGITRMVIAVSPQDENYVYVLGSAGFLKGLYRSKDGGNNWETLVEGGPTYSEIFGSNGQGNYDICLTVDPLNKERVIMGGVTLAEWSKEKGFAIIGSMFAAITSNSYVHADKHEFVWDETVNPPVLWIGTDGGLFRSANMNANDYDYIFSAQNRGFGTMQFYGLAAAEDGTVVGGTQDNSNVLINGRGNTPKSGVTLISGDGFQSEISAYNPRIMFVESQYGNMVRSTNGGVAFSSMWDIRIGDEDADVNISESYAPFDCQFRLWEDFADSSNTKLYFAPYGHLWAAVNPMNSATNPNWFKIADLPIYDRFNIIRLVDLEPSKDGDHLFYTLSNGQIFRIDSINSAVFDTSLYPSATNKLTIPTPIVTKNIKGNLPTGTRVITSINIDPNNPNRAIVTVGNYGNTNYVFLSNNILDDNPTYTDITGNLPKMPVYDALILIDNPNYFVLATEMGIWASDDNGATWELQNDGIPTVGSYILRQYEFKPWEGPRIYVGTHGRGFFKTGTFLTSIKNVEASINNASILAFPNPATDIVNIKFDVINAGNVSYTVYNLQGQQVLKEVEAADKGAVTKKIDVSFLKPGTYIVSIGAGTTKKSVKVLVQ